MTGGHWLDDEEQAAWQAYLGLVSHVGAALETQMQRDGAMPHAYYELLARLSAAPDRAMRMSDLAQVTRSSRSRLSHAVATLESRGWVRRQDCPTDRRGQVAVLTDEGLTVLAAAAPGHVAEVRAALFDRLTPEQVAQLRQLAEAVLAGREPLVNRACG